MYAKLNNGQVQIYPYTIGTLRKDNPNVSFPKSIGDDVLTNFNVVSVTQVPMPDDTSYLKNVERSVVQVNGSWTEQWNEVDATAEEITNRTEMKKLAVRSERDTKLAQTDWRFRSDMSPSQEWIDYCQALRDIPAQAGFPWDVTWPNEPGAN
jgi:hypothetical protein